MEVDPTTALAIHVAVGLDRSDEVGDAAGRQLDLADQLADLGGPGDPGQQRSGPGVWQGVDLLLQPVGVDAGIDEWLDQVVGTGDIVSTRGEDSWGTVEIDGTGTIQVGPDARVAFDRIGEVLHLSLLEGGLRYRVQPGAQVVVEAANATVVLGARGTGLVPAALGEAVGGVAVDGEAVYARNRTGDLEIITADGVTEPVAEGQLLAVNSPASPNGSPVSLQVGSGGTGVGTAAAE
ncbi:MAG: hypothetical protein AAGF02_08660, partial [Actinomycetota bacterium]